MSFTERVTMYRRMSTDNVAWTLLRTDNAALILAFLSDLFSKTADVPVAIARAQLEANLDIWRSLGMKTETEANVYLSNWAKDGYIRELNGFYSMTDGANIAIRFAESLDRRDLAASASNLRIVQEAVQSLSIDLSGDIEERVNLLISRRRDIDSEIDALGRGEIESLSPAQQLERVKTVLQLARMLTGNFTFLEEEIRRQDQVQRQQMIENLDGRGVVLEQVLDSIDQLSGSPEGRAFKGFHQLLADDVRSTEFRAQLKMICESSAGAMVTAQEQRFLKGLVLELNRESKRVIERRTRSEQALRAYIESGAFRENKRIEKLIEEIKRVATTLPQLDNYSPKRISPLTLRLGKAQLSPVPGWRLKEPLPEILEIELVERKPRTEISREVLDQLRQVRSSEVAGRLIAGLRTHGPQTLATLAHFVPVNQGIEEVVARVRIAHDIRGTQLKDEEWIEFSERDGLSGRARIPSIQIEAGMFPADLESLNT